MDLPLNVGCPSRGTNATSYASGIAAAKAVLQGLVGYAVISGLDITETPDLATDFVTSMDGGVTGVDLTSIVPAGLALQLNDARAMGSGGSAFDNAGTITVVLTYADATSDTLTLGAANCYPASDTWALYDADGLLPTGFYVWLFITPPTQKPLASIALSGNSLISGGVVVLSGARIPL